MCHYRPKISPIPNNNIKSDLYYSLFQFIKLEYLFNEIRMTLIKIPNKKMINRLNITSASMHNML
jgi:hypothetical protein